MEYDNAYIIRCDGCHTLLRWPLEILDEGDEREYGESYYNQMASREAFEQNVQGPVQYQILHYKQLLDLLLRRVTPESHPKWLDVGSSGAPTAYSDFEFTTVEPDHRIVAHGQKLFH